MGEKYLTPSAIILLVLRKSGGRTEVLCQRRSHTDFAEGLFDFSCAGKVEKGEAMTDAVIREAAEELGIVISKENLSFAGLVHKFDREYDVVFYNAYFTVEEYSGTPHICESEKCSELKWFDIDNLPDDMIDDRKAVLANYLAGGRYLEYGWEK